ncbi:MAG: hypothetical protein LBF79_00145 [Dysgonamonadaceae bacterium]|jgi:hypothetical protein|nr:hypothetical protein [Dysgonamonadaceae bacterium]
MKAAKLIPVFLFILVPKGIANDSIPVEQRIVTEQSLTRQFFTLPYLNPALKRFLFDFRLTEIKAESDYGQEKKAIAVQEGDGRQIYGVNVRSYIPLPNNCLWGDASYHNGVRRNLRFNETSDASLLYPYLTGDTIGGDMQSEVYSFSGGYAGQIRQFTWGINAGFRATQEYRAVDPRPNNIASMLDLTAGMAFRTGGSYLAGVAIHFQKYKQKNEIAFYNELGDIKVYHYTGLAMDYARFRTKADKSHYNGNAAGVSLDLLPQRHSGWVATVKYNHFNFEKIISSLNELNMLEATEHAFETEAGYRKSGKRQNASFKLNAYSVRRQGTENIFGDESSNNYPWIAAVDQYRRTQTGLEVVSLYEQTAEASVRWSLQPALGYEAEKERYIFPERKTNLKKATLAVHGSLSKIKGKFLFIANAEVKQHFPIHHEISLIDTEIENYALPVLYSNYYYQSGRQTHIELNQQVNYTLRQNYALFIALRWQHGRYVGNIAANYITASCGIRF